MLKPELRHKLEFFRRSSARTAQTLATLVVVLGGLRSLSAQQDVHAALIEAPMRQKSPPFSLTDAKGRRITQATYRGKVVLLNFWATDCGGCVLEIPTLESLQKTFEGHGFTVVGLASDLPYDKLKSEREGWDKVRPFILTHHVNYPVVMGTGTVFTDFRITAYPVTFLVDKSGRIAAKYQGVVNAGDVERNIRLLENE